MIVNMKAKKVHNKKRTFLSLLLMLAIVAGSTLFWPGGKATVQADEPPFVEVTGIEPSTTVAWVDMDTDIAFNIMPADATRKHLYIDLVDAGTTQVGLVTNPDGRSVRVHPMAEGTIILKVTVPYGLTSGEFTKEFPIEARSLPPFVEVTGIDPSPSEITVGVETDIVFRVLPDNATEKHVVVDLMDEGGTQPQLTTNADESVRMLARKEGTMTLNVMVPNGLSSSPYNQEVTIKVLPIVEVTGIQGVPGEIKVGEAVTVKGNVIPADATKKTVKFTLKDAGNTQAAAVENADGSLTVTAQKEGTITVLATAPGGLSSGDFTQEFSIQVTAKPQNPPEPQNTYDPATDTGRMLKERERLEEERKRMQWSPSTPEEKESALYRSAETPVYTAALNGTGNTVPLKIESEMQGKEYLNGIKALLSAPGSDVEGYQIGNTYNFYPDNSSLSRPLYSTQEKIRITLKIPDSLVKEGRKFKLICLGEKGAPYIYPDLDEENGIITIETDKFYAYTLVYMD